MLSEPITLGHRMALLGLCVLLTHAANGSETLDDIRHARVCVTGAIHNRPVPFPGLGDFIGWPGGVELLPVSGNR